MAEQEFTTKELVNEIWKPVVGYEALYEVSSLGRVKRVACYQGRMGILHPSFKKTGYIGFSLSANNVKKHFLAHRLVAAAFIGPSPDGYVVNHKDGKKPNNRPVNLEYVTRTDNENHAVINGLKAKGEHHPKTTLTEPEVKEIRNRYEAGETTMRTIGRIYKTSRTTVGDIVRRRTWKHVP